MTQIDQLAGDSSYNGVNLLAGDTLQVLFNENGTSSLSIAGVKFNSKGLGLSAASGTGFLDNANITSSETAINAAITAVRAQTETFGTNASTIQTRQTFEQNMINTLQTGASNLVLADQNQESANLLSLQTRQQLEIGAVHRQPGEPVGPQAVPIIPSGAGLRRRRGESHAAFAIVPFRSRIALHTMSRRTS